MNALFWKDRNVLITGATGLLGSWMSKYLVEAGANLTVLVRDWVPASKLISDKSLEKANLIRGNLETLDTLVRAVNEYEVDTVFHLGAQTIVPIANTNPVSTFESNIKGTWNVLEACRISGHVKRIVVASSDKAYGSQKKLPYDETMPLQGEHPYDVSKSCADLLAQSYHKSFGLPVCVTRCGNFYGGGDLNFNRLIPGTIKSALKNEKPVIRSDGTLVRDYFYIEDGVEAYLLLAEKMIELKLEGQAFNFSNELQITVREMVTKILALTGSKFEPVILNEIKNEIMHQYLSAEKARRVLGWKVRFSLEDSLKRTIEWYREFFNRK